MIQIKIHNSMKSEIDAVNIEYDQKHDRFAVLNIGTPLWVRLVFLVTGRHLFIVTNAKLLANKIRNKELNENQ